MSSKGEMIKGHACVRPDRNHYSPALRVQDYYLL